MGSLFKCLDPSAPDESVRQFWHIHGLLLDASVPSCSSEQQQQQQENHENSVDTLQVGDGSQQGSQKMTQKTKTKKKKTKQNNNEEKETMAAAEDGDKKQKKKGKKEEKQKNGNMKQQKGNKEDMEQLQQQLEPKQIVQRLPPGVLYVYEGRLVYRARRWSPCCPWLIGSSNRTAAAAVSSEGEESGGTASSDSSGGNGGGRRARTDELAVELCQIGAVNVTQHFVSQRDNKLVRCHYSPIVDVLVTGRQPPLHIGILIAQAEAVAKELRECSLKHRLRPRIFQFNSVDIDGVEIDVP